QIREPANQTFIGRAENVLLLCPSKWADPHHPDTCLGYPGFIRFLMISPYVAPGTVHHTYADTDSMDTLVESNGKLPPHHGGYGRQSSQSAPRSHQPLSSPQRAGNQRFERILHAILGWWQFC
ncbi:MAG: hypothetical protein PHP75_10060, partial [Methylacidiphilaceae bacterium]|nr:hypothetical protein [Candidatus Methylacidiphilaceae bacterium]